MIKSKNACGFEIKTKKIISLVEKSSKTKRRESESKVIPKAVSARGGKYGNKEKTMEEKKLTDEEIVKAWECHMRDGVTCGKDCPYREKDISCLGGRHARDTIDLIHRLQNEVQRLAKVEMEHIGMIADQKAELERLTEENAIIKVNPPMIVGRNNGKTIRAKLLAFDKMKEQNAELQKQVDELKKSQVVHIHIDDKLQKEYEYELKQAVKDTAKEIIDELNSIKPNVRATYGVQEQVGVDIAINRVKTYFKQKGVEVE